MTNAEFTKKYFPIAEQVTRGTGIFPATLLAAAIVESGSGTSAISKKTNNFFGIKTGGQWSGPSYNRSTKEFLKVTPKTNNNNFRVYSSPAAGFKGYVNFLQRNQRYKDALKAQTYQEQIIKIANAGYAEESNYSSVLIPIAQNVSKYIPELMKLLKNNKNMIAAFLGITAATILYFSTTQTTKANG